MNKYKNLMSNTMVFAIATFGSKLLPFLLLKFYTMVLTPEAYSLQELIVTTCNLILPIMYLSMSEAVIRYALDNTLRKRDVFTTGILTVLCGYLVLICFMPLISKIPEIGGHLGLIYSYVIASALHSVISQFVRASGFVRLFAIDGIFTTLTTVLLNILLLVKFKMGAPGYVLSTIIADALSSVILFFMLKLYRFIKIRGIDGGTVAMMFRYAVPLVPTAVFWWVTNLSDRYFVRFMCGEAANGIFSLSYKLPNLITLVSMIFTQAWQLSAFTEYKNPDGEKFYSTVFRSYYTFVFIAASALILLCKPVTFILSGRPEFREAWRYTPFLVLGVAFSTLVTFLGTVYNAVQKNGMVTFTTFIGAIANILLNYLLIPVYGPQGAAFATFISFLVVFIIRAVHCQRYIRIRMQPLRIAMTLLLLLLQSYIGFKAPPKWILWESLILALIIVCNLGYVWFMLERILGMLPAREKA